MFTSGPSSEVSNRFNRNIVECKYETGHNKTGGTKKI